MELAPNRFKTMNRDVIAEIMSRFDGCTLAAIASTCTDLHFAAGDEGLWQKLCNDTWPSTSIKQLPFQISSSKTGSFKSLYAGAYPLISNEVSTSIQKQNSKGTAVTSFSPYDFISLVDIYYNGHCIFSKVVDGLIEGNHETCREIFNRFLCYPFTLDLLGIECSETTDHDFQDSSSMDDNLTNLLLAAFTGTNERENLCNKIAADIRLSWILFNTTNGKAVNLSSWKPRSIHRNKPLNEDYEICFGCVVPAGDSHKLTEFVIMARCKLLTKQGSIRWKEITLVIKDLDGSHLNGEQSLRVMNQALHCSSSINHGMVEKGYQQFQKWKIELKAKNELEESLANILCAMAAIISLLVICYACATLL